MAARKGQSHKLHPAELKEAVDAVVRGGSISKAAESLNLSRQAVQNRIDQAAALGMIKPRTESNPSRWRPGPEIVAARKAEYARVKASGPLVSGNVIHLPDDGPFMLVALGDPHLDNPGTDLELWERWIGVLDRSKHRTGILMGDLLDNWVKPLAHLYSTAETPAPEGWLLLEHYLDEVGSHIDICVQGNHDLWSGHSDVAGMLLDRYGILQRGNSIRVAYRNRFGREITVNCRHSWPGRSQWNEAHGIRKAARLGIRDTILLGGHTHVTGHGVEKCPMTGRLTFCHQTASFKLQDDYADTLGLMDRHVSPGVALVVDPRRSDDDPELVHHFYDPEPASEYLAFLRRKK
jgi:hypothetical protein